ncbi:hypothetical protein [Dinghuibacter silviterrae]|uniref:Uncharacterized protein n=1 Tax=Dinghuibacter silviterrae TaxID=1539049 RepID=A0A4R8DI37_9BACT|nr:hypothetical protein [Dinghuibacter silviterrae]TDW97138.1 hypothetical protein EDB95_4979 [Dinghuibacter silviterrae]
MTVSIVSTAVFDTIAAQLLRFADHPHKDLNIPQGMNLSTSNVQWLIRTWQRLNQETCMAANPKRTYELAPLLEVKKAETEMDPVQFLKYLEYLDLFIDVNTIEDVWCLSSEEFDALDLLHDLLFKVMQGIIVQLPDYAAARWPDDVER